MHGRSSTSLEFFFTYASLPKLFDPSRMNVSSRSSDRIPQMGSFWRGKWEIWIEPGAAGTGVLDGTAFFSAWKTRYLADKPATPPLERVFRLDDPNTVLEGSAGRH